MRLGFKIFFCYLTIFLLCFSFPYDWVLDSLKTRYYESVEEVLIDEANILAALVGQAMVEKRFAPESLRFAFDQANNRTFSAQIYDVIKYRVDQRVYITDGKGKVLFDSRSEATTGEDYSGWIDVGRTLRGEYGARTSKAPEEQGGLSVFHVAAPVKVEDELVGVLTVAKPTTATHTFISRAKSQLYRVAGGAISAAFILCLLMAMWITRPIKRLTDYANSVRKGERPDFPSLDRTEIGTMGQAFEKMREALEGKKYVEQYIQTLTHEIKSPLSAIIGATELLKEEMDEKSRIRFLTNIGNESARIKELVDRLLELAALESRSIIVDKKRIPLKSLIRTVLESKQPMIILKDIEIQLDVEAGLQVEGDSFLLHQALANLVQNGVDFSPPRGVLHILGCRKRDKVILTIENEGPHIPDYARERIFERFFSLARPITGKKSTGLGLNLVKEVVTLHHGTVTLENLQPGGVRATIILPDYR